MAKDLDKELAELEKDYGKGVFEIDEEYQVIKKKGYKCYKGSDIPQLAFDTVAEYFANAEGKDYSDSKVKDEMEKRLKPNVSAESL